MSNQNVFRLQGKNLFLTYPQCDTSKEQVLDNIYTEFGNDVAWAIVCEESHVDGQPHIHAIIRLHVQNNRRGMDYLDKLTGKHGNYQLARSLRKVAKYVVKDGNYTAKGISVQDLIKEKQDPIMEIIESIKAGANLQQIYREFPKQFFHHRKKIDAFIYFAQAQMTSHIPWQDVLTANDDLGFNSRIWDWFVENIQKERAPRTKQLFIWGAPGIGKTRLWIALMKFLKVYPVPTGEDFYDAYNDKYDLLIFDEFKGQKTLQFMNQFLAGAPMYLRTKGGQTLKSCNVPMIICSNYSPYECYQNKNHNDFGLMGFIDRLQVVEATAEELKKIYSFLESFQ
jgi:hypothetical protein